MKIYHKLLFLILFAVFTNTYAFNWHDLWQTRNHQANLMMKAGKYSEAERTFTNENWQATAAFRAKDYKKAALIYAKSKHGFAYYNNGNALAYMGKYKEAIAAYNQALSINEQDKDALYNRKIVEEMLKEQNKSKQENNKDKEKQKDQENQQNNQDNDENKNDKEDNKNKANDENQKNKPKNDGQSGEKKDEEKPQEAENKDIDQSAGSSDKQQMKDQWLRLIPDDPGGLLREKFRRDHMRRRGES
jgi:Ca-activated chloride channel homolog